MVNKSRIIIYWINSYFFISNIKWDVEKTQSILRLIILYQELLRFFIIQMIISFIFFQVSVKLMYLSQSQNQVFSYIRYIYYE